MNDKTEGGRVGPQQPPAAPKAQRTISRLQQQVRDLKSSRDHWFAEARKCGCPAPGATGVTPDGDALAQSIRILRDDLADAAERKSTRASVTTWNLRVVLDALAAPAAPAPWKPTDLQIVEAAQAAGLWPNAVQHWLPAFDRFFEHLGLVAPCAETGGWRTVPAEPTLEMERAAGEAARRYMEETGGNSPRVIYRAMLAAAPAAPAAGWQPIETAPRDGKAILAWIDWWDGPAACTGRFKDDGFWPDHRDHESKTPTHWMPLPAAPGAEVLAAAPAAPAEPAARTIYVEARECSDCGHVGINDGGEGAACTHCDWTGPSPSEDVCPGCGHAGTMTAACPECGHRTSLLASASLPAAPAEPVNARLLEALEECVGWLRDSAPKHVEEDARAAIAAAEAQPKPLDDPRLQDLFSCAISGALGLGAEGVKPPPDGHWLEQWWQRGRAIAAEKAPPAPAQPLLVRDLAEIVGLGVPQVCKLLTEMGHPPRSTNMAVSADEAVAVAKAARPAPVGYIRPVDVGCTDRALLYPTAGEAWTTPVYLAPPAAREPLSEEQIVACLVEAGCVGTVKMSYDTGPYDVTRPSINATRFARAIERAHRIVGAAGEKGGA